MSRKQTIIDLINLHDYKNIAEIGVWNGDLTFSLLSSCKNITKYIMVDPLTENLNTFFYEQSNFDFPKMMNSNSYECKMGGDRKTQMQLDEMYNNIIFKINNDSRVSFIRQESKLASEHIDDNSLDFVFIDAIHLYENVKEDINLWFPKVKFGGMLAGDDFLNDFPGVIKAVKELLPNYRDSNGVWFIKK